MAKPIANYLPYQHASPTVVYIAGQIPVIDGKPQFVGLVGQKVSVEEAKEAAKLCIKNFIAQATAAAGGDINNVKRVVKLNVFIACGAEFTRHPEVGNGASDYLVSTFGDKFRHARAAVGVASLPLGVPVEIDGVIEIAPRAKL